MTPRNATLSMTTLVLALCGATLPAGSEPAAAQPADTGFSERVEVNLVNVDVWVTDAQGQPVTGLEADSFEILHDGRPVAITHFTEVRPDSVDMPQAAAVEPARPASPTDAFPSHVVVYFDRSRLHPRHYPALIGSLEEFLDDPAVDSERVLILRQDRGLAVEAPFGSSREELGLALDRLAQGAPSGMDLETDTRLALEAIRDIWEQSQGTEGSGLSGLGSVPGSVGTGQPPGTTGGGSGAGGPRSVVGGVGSGAGPDACGMFVNQIQPTLDSWTRSNSQRVAVTLSNLSSAAGFLAGLPGVKALIYLSDGLETQPGADLATYASSLCPGAGSELMTNALSAEMTSGFRDLTRHANANRVTFYSLQTSGLRALESGDASGGRAGRRGGRRARGSFEASKRASDREGLGLIATETGGRAVFNKNELGPELKQIGHEIQHYYSLAYQPPAAGAGDKRRDHQIEVKMLDGALSPRYRRGYLEMSQDQKLRQRIEGALNLGITSNPLAVRLGAGAVEEPAPGSYRLPLHVMVPVERLAFLPDQGSFFAQVTLQILTRAIDGNELITHDKVFRVKGSPDATGFADLAVALELGAGTHVTAIGVQDANTGEASFVSTNVRVGPES